ncbi:hypothetical protein [Anaplasma capra]|uniref:hypothetical protein n=1 Tax=Anaplasma capra TaxID=1562740 RepID=UPI0021D5C39C|nr:hypothetical protein [Anaplasma capra]
MHRHIWFVVVASAAAFSCAVFIKNLIGLGSHDKIVTVSVKNIEYGALYDD